MIPTPPLVLHDFFTAPDGGGRVATILARSFNAELWTGDLILDAYPPDYFKDITPRSLDAYTSAPFWLRFSKILQLWWAFSHFPISSSPWTVFSGSFAPLAHKRVSGRRMYYCLTPPRLLYDQKRFILEHLPGWQRPLLKMIMWFYRLAYERSLKHMDRIVTISETIRRRIRKYLDCDSQVIYPPCEIERFRWIAGGDFYLSTARVDPLKRVALIVQAFKQMPDQRLVVVSGGSDLAKIKQISADTSNIEILGWVDGATLVDLMGRCRATLYIPRDEDFGISPVESMAAGKPVIGVQEGGVLETVGFRGQRSEVGGQRPEDKDEGSVRIGFEKGLLITKCGVLVPSEPKVEEVVEAVQWMTSERATEMRLSCENRARTFGTDVFAEKMREVFEG